MWNFENSRLLQRADHGWLPRTGSGRQQPQQHYLLLSPTQSAATAAPAAVAATSSTPPPPSAVEKVQPEPPLAPAAAPPQPQQPQQQCEQLYDNSELRQLGRRLRIATAVAPIQQLAGFLFVFVLLVGFLVVGRILGGVHFVRTIVGWVREWILVRKPGQFGPTASGSVLRAAQKVKRCHERTRSDPRPWELPDPGG